MDMYQIIGLVLILSGFLDIILGKFVIAPKARPESGRLIETAMIIAGILFILLGLALFNGALGEF